jgi:hypothetical protein
MADENRTQRMRAELARAKARAMESKRKAAAAPRGERTVPATSAADIWKDVGLSALSGLRSGAEQAVGGTGDIAAFVNQFMPQPVREAASRSMPLASAALSMAPTSEQVGRATEQALPEAVNALTRHEATTPFGQAANVGANVGSGFIGGPETLAAKLLTAKGLIGGMHLAAAPLALARREAPAVARAAERALPKVEGTVGDIANAPAMFEGVSPREFKSTEDWHRFGEAHGVPNLGSPSQAEWEKSLAPFTTAKGQQFTVPGGVESKSPFTYYDLLHLKQQGINPNDIPPGLHQAIHDRFLATMSQGEQTPERIMNQLMLAQISPNQPLTPNELAVARGMVKGPEDLQKLGAMVPWRYSDDPATISKEMRAELSSKIANQLGLGAGATGGLGARGTADYTRIAETAQRMQADPEFFRFRGAGEGGGADPNDPKNWANFVERLANQTPGLSSKTGSFGAVWQNPAEANISAVDRHMASKFNREMFPSTEEFDQFQETAINRWNKANPERQIDTYEALPQGFKNDQMFGYLNSNPAMKYRGKALPGSNSGVGPVNPRVPEHLQPEQAQWVHEPEKVELISEPYRRVLEANAASANQAGQSIFGNQWMLWDRIRNRLEPHEIMFPGLEKLPRMSMEQMQGVRSDLSKAGYMSGTKEIDPVTGQPKLQAVRPLPSASRAAYFDLGPLLGAGAAAGGGAAMVEALRQRQAEQGGSNAL